MDVKLLKKANSANPGERFPEFPPREDMNNPLFLYRQGYMTTLYRHFGSQENTIVLSETPLAWHHHQWEGTLIPDLLVAFDVDAEDVVVRRGYAVSYQGKAPEFVLEVASESTGRRRDEGAKREGYQAYGVQEYWRYDPLGADNFTGTIWPGTGWLTGFIGPSPFTKPTLPTSGDTVRF